MKVEKLRMMVVIAHNDENEEEVKEEESMRSERVYLAVGVGGGGVLLAGSFSALINW